MEATIILTGLFLIGIYIIRKASAFRHANGFNRILKKEYNKKYQ